MILFRTSTLVPERFRTAYRMLRIVLVLIFLALSVSFARGVLFPPVPFSFSFSENDPDHNTLESPVSADGGGIRDGRIGPSDTLRTYAGTVGRFSSVRVRITLVPSSPIPPKGDLRLSIRKSYRSFFYPKADTMTGDRKEHGVIINGTPYLFSDDRLFPFISERAALSRFPHEDMIAANAELLTLFPPQKTKAGFREGSILSDGREAYAIGSDGNAHRIRNADAFEAFGFRPESVLPVSEAELAFHPRGSDLSVADAQPDGTVFRQTDTGTVFLVDEGAVVPIGNDDYRNALLQVSAPIEIPTDPFSAGISCVPERSPLHRSAPLYECDLPLETLSGLSGGSFELSLSSSAGVSVDSIGAVFRTAPGRDTFDRFLTRLRTSLADRYGNGPDGRR